MGIGGLGATDGMSFRYFEVQYGCCGVFGAC